MEDTLQKLADINQLTLQGIQAFAAEMRNIAAASTEREQNMVKGFANTLQATQQHT